MSKPGIADIDVVGENVAAPNESCYIRGPPGCGKTTQSMVRIHRLVYDFDVYPGEIAWVTYRRSLAGETLSRLEEADVIDEQTLQDPAQGMTRYVGTFHAVAFRALLDNLSRREIEREFGVDKRDELEAVSERDKVAFCKYRDMRYFTDNPWEKSEGKTLFRLFEWLQNNLYDPTDPDHLRECDLVDELREEHDFNGSIISLWGEWQDYKAQIGKIGFAEMLRECLNRGISLSDRRVLIIDEFHDATPLMAELGKMWAQDMDVTIVAGDEDQIVNAYAGPSRDLFHDIREQLNLPEVMLGHSWRLNNEHWAAATRMLSNAHSPPNITREGHGPIYEHGSPRFQASSEMDGWGVTPSPTDEAGPVDLYDSTEGTMMYLARMRVQVAGISAALDKAGIIHRSQRELGGWLGDDDDRLPVHNALQKLTQADVSNAVGGHTQLGQFSAGTKPLNAINLSHVEADRILHYAPASYLDKPRSDIDDVRERIKEDEQPVSLADLEEYVTQKFWQNLTNGSASVSRLNKRSMSRDDRKALQRALSRYDAPMESEAVDVTVQTIHASKGSEAAHVVVYDGVSGRIETEMQADPQTRRNEWRTWYVALSRADEALHIMRGAFRDMNCRSIIPDDIMTSVRQTMGGSQ